jgi:hypothetical protein
MNSIMPYTPQESLDMVRALSAIVQELRTTEFKAEVDYGIIPGTSKPTLLLPGMEKLMRALRLRAEYVATEKMIDFEAGIFFYEFECRLYEVESGLCVGTAIGSANSRETKWRWRDAKRACPKCGEEHINRSKFPPKNNPNAEPGWYCYAKAGGCGAEFSATDPAITNQVIGRIENPDIADQANTICKIAQKRSLSSAIKCVANVSAFFTVDIEDMPRHSLGSFDAQPAAPDNVVEGSFTPVVVEKPATPKKEQLAQPSKPVTQQPLEGATPTFDAETANEFLTWITHELDMTYDDVTAALQHANGEPLTSITAWTHGYFAAAAAVLAFNMGYAGDKIAAFIGNVKRNQGAGFRNQTGGQFKPAELEQIRTLALKLVKFSDAKRRDDAEADGFARMEFEDN